MKSLSISSKEQNNNRSKVCTALTVISLLLVVLTYTGWLVMTDSIRYLSMIISVLFSLIIGFILVRIIPFLVDSFYGIEKLPAPLSIEPKYKHQIDHTVLYIVLIAILTRVFYAGFLYIASTICYGYRGGLFDLIKPILGANENEYLSIVGHWNSIFSTPYGYFPLFPVLVTLLNYLVHSITVSGTIISFVSFVLCCLQIFSVCTSYFDKRTSFFAVILFCVLPTSYILNLPLPYAMLLFFALMSLRHLIKKNYYTSVAFAFLSIFTNPLGILCIIPIAYVLGSDILQKTSKKSWKKLKDEYLPYILLTAALLLPYIAFRLFAGTSKSYFSFCSGRETHITYVYSNISSLISSFIYGIRKGYFFIHLLPYVWNFIMLLLPLAVIFMTYKNIPAAVTAYGLVLTILTINTTDKSMLSFYFSFNIACLFGISASIKKTWIRFLLGILSLIVSLVILFVFIWKGGTIQ